MNEVENEIQQLEDTIEECRKLVARGDVLRRLMNNPDFNSLIEEDYLREERIRLGGLVGSPNTGIKQEDVITDLAGTAALQRYLSLVLHLANAGKDQIEQAEQEILSLREEMANGVSGVVHDSEEDF